MRRLCCGDPTVCGSACESVQQAPSDRVREKWREHARLDDYGLRPRYITGIELDPEELEKIVNDLSKQIFLIGDHDVTWG